MASDAATLTVVEAESDASTPVLLHFPAGLPPPSALTNAPKEGGAAPSTPKLANARLYV